MRLPRDLLWLSVLSVSVCRVVGFGVGDGDRTMSGGSFNYLCHKSATEIMESGRVDLAQMATELESLGHLARPVAEATRALADRLGEVERELDAEVARLEPIWHAVEWWRSCDWSKDQVFVAIGEWKERERSQVSS